MTPEQYGKRLKRSIDNEFNTQQEAANYFNCSPTMVTLVIQTKKMPTEEMLVFTGHEQVITKTVQYFKSK